MAAPEAEPTRRCGWKGCPLPVVPAAFVEGTIFLSGRMVEVRVEVCSEHFEAVTGEHLTELDVAR